MKRKDRGHTNSYVIIGRFFSGLDMPGDWFGLQLDGKFIVTSEEKPILCQNEATLIKDFTEGTVGGEQEWHAIHLDDPIMEVDALAWMVHKASPFIESKDLSDPDICTVIRQSHGQVTSKYMLNYMRYVATFMNVSSLFDPPLAKVPYSLVVSRLESATFEGGSLRFYVNPDEVWKLFDAIHGALASDILPTGTSYRQALTDVGSLLKEAIEVENDICALEADQMVEQWRYVASLYT